MSGSTLERVETLRPVVTPVEQESLAGWARGRAGFSAQALRSIRSWDHAPDSLPLMIALYHPDR